MDILLAGAVAALHFGYLAYVPLGGFLAWRRPGLLLPHVAAVGWGFCSVAFGMDCPLTRLESVLRVRAGWPPLLPGGFIDHYLEGVVYPARYTPLVLGLAAGLIGWSWSVVLRRAYRRTAHLKVNPSGR